MRILCAFISPTFRKAAPSRTTNVIETIQYRRVGGAYPRVGGGA